MDEKGRNKGYMGNENESLFLVDHFNYTNPDVPFL